MGSPQLPFFIGQIKIGDGSNFNTSFGVYDFTPTIQTAQAAVATTDPNAHLIESQSFSLLSDLIHFDHIGKLGLGAAFANNYLQTIPEPSTTMLSMTTMALLMTIHRQRY